MPSPKIAVAPYLHGGKLNVPVDLDGKEVFEGEVSLELLFTHFALCINPSDLGDEAEAYNLIECLENGIRTINNKLGE